MYVAQKIGAIESQLEYSTSVCKISFNADLSKFVGEN